MGCGLTSGLTSGKQLTLEQESLNIQIADNEAKVRDDYIKNILPVTSPIQIPSNARILVQNKDFCSQIKYQWTCDGYNYTSIGIHVHRMLLVIKEIVGLLRDVCLGLVQDLMLDLLKENYSLEKISGYQKQNGMKQLELGSKV